MLIHQQQQHKDRVLKQGHFYPVGNGDGPVSRLRLELRSTRQNDKFNKRNCTKFMVMVHDMLIGILHINEDPLIVMHHV